jgi:imidazolonepropionase-like amidohydrolase
MLLLVIGTMISAQQIQKAEKGTFLLKNGTVHTVTKGTLVADILVKNGLIADIGSNLSATGAKIVDCTDKHVYPGFIDGGTRLGLSEVGSVSLTQDYNELGDFIPHMQTLTAVNPNSAAIPVTRTNGVTTVIVTPAGGLFPGTATLINLVGYTPDQMYGGFNAIVVNFPSSGRRGRRDNRSDEDIKKAEEKALEKLNDIVDKARLYSKIDSAAMAEKKSRNDYNPQMDALVPVLRGEVPLMIEVNKDKDIKAAIKWVKEQKINAIFTGVAEGYRVANELAEAKIPVITGPVLSTPSRSSDSYDAPYANAGKMLKAGVKVALRTMEIENVRNLPFNAGFAAAYGMGIEEALKSITIIPAEIFGLDDRYGSIEKNKIANLLVSNGDPFETKTDIEHLFISGWKVPIENRHTLLYDEFLERTPGLKN